MKVHRIRLSKDQGLRPWEPADTGTRLKFSGSSLFSLDHE